MVCTDWTNRYGSNLSSLPEGAQRILGAVGDAAATTYDNFKNIAERITRSLGYEMLEMEEQTTDPTSIVLRFKLKLANIPVFWNRDSFQRRAPSARLDS